MESGVTSHREYRLFSLWLVGSTGTEYGDIIVFQLHIFVVMSAHDEADIVGAVWHR